MKKLRELVPSVRMRIAALSNFLAVLLVMILGYSLIFQWLMALEGRDYSLTSGLYWTLVTMSTLGYGDIVFTSDLGKLFSVVVLLSGMVFLLVLLPFMFIEFVYTPWLASQNADRLPREVDEELSGHVIMTFAGPVARALITRLARFGYDYVVISSHEAEVLSLREEGIEAILGDLDDPDTFKRARVHEAAMVATTRSDIENAAIVFTARGVAPSVPIYATVRENAAADVLRLAGCTRTINLSELMGTALARRAAGGKRVAQIIGKIDDLTIAEVEASKTRLIGQTLNEAQSATAISVVGVMERGESLAVEEEKVISEASTLVLAGSAADLKEFDREFALDNEAISTDQHIIIVGGGRVGRCTARALEYRGIDYRIVEELPDRNREDAHYIQGSAAEREVLESAGIRKASTVIITTRDDDTNIYLTIFARLLRPDIRIICRSTAERNVAALNRAGANTVVSYASMGANSLFNLLKRSDLMMIAEGLDVFKVVVPESLAGKSLEDAAIRAKTGCAVIGIDHHEQTLTQLRPSTVLPKNAEIILLGTVDGEQAFVKVFQ